MDPPPEPGWPDRHIWRIRPVRDALLFGGAVLLVWFAARITELLVPLFVGLLLAYIAHPLVTLAQRRLSVPRPASAGVLLGVLALALVGVGWWLGPVLADQVVTLVQRLPSYLERLGLTSGRLDWSDLAERARAQLARAPWDSSELLATAGGILGFTLHAIYWVLLPPIGFFFFAWWMPGMYDAAMRHVPASRRERTRDILGEMNDVVGGFLRGRLIVSLIVGVLFSLGFLLADVPYWFVLGVVTGLLSAVPYLSTLGWIVAVVVKYADMMAGSGDVAWAAVLLWPSLAYWVVNLLEEWVLIPWIQSKSMNLSSFTVLVVALIGGEVAGLLGLLLAVPVAGCIKVFLTRVVIPPLAQWAATR